MTEVPQQREAPQPYLAGDFSKELSYQLWSTKSARFQASERLNSKQRWSTYAITALSLYAIAANLALAYKVISNPEVATVFAFASSALSVAILTLALLEGSRQYELKADRIHSSALELNSLYRELRQLRTGPGVGITAENVTDLRKRYEDVLKLSENHSEIDYQLVRAKKSEYFSLNAFQRIVVYVKWYFVVVFIYHLLVFGPVALLAWWWCTDRLHIGE